MFSTGFNLEPVEEVPEDAQRMATGVSLELEQDEWGKAQSLAGTVERLSTEYQRELHSIVGDENLEAYHDLRRRLRERVGEIASKAEPTVVGEAEIQEARLQAAEESRAFLQEIGFDMPRASELRGEFHTRFHHLIAETLGRPEEPNYLVPPEMVPEDIHNPWVWYAPPYPGWRWIRWTYDSGRPWTPDYWNYLDHKAGQLGTYTHIHVSNASDSDYAYVRFRTGMRFWYWMPVAGMAEVWMRLQCINTPYSGYLKDEWGWSDSVCDQESRAYVQAIYPGPGAPRMSTILDYRRTGTDASWANHREPAGQYRWAHIFSSGAYPGGSWVLLEAGTEDFNFFWSNDVSIHSAMTMRWFLKNIVVRSTGE